MTRYFTADTHFNHKAVHKMRITNDFSSMDDHDDYILDKINSTVNKHDLLYILGDFAFTEPQKFKQKIRCKFVTLIIGNHDRRTPSRHAFGEYFDVKMIKLDCGSQAFLSHYPHAFWPSSHHNNFHFYGHCHYQREDSLNQIWPNRRSIDVGVDSAKMLLGDYRPFSEQELMDILGSRTGHDPVDFYHEYRKNRANRA